MLRLAGTRTADDPGGVPGVLDEAGRELAGALDALRELAGGLYPVVLADAGLGPALESLAQRAAVPTVVASAPDGRLPEAVEQAGYFVVAEVLDRAARLDGVHEVVVEAGVAGGRLRLRVSHDAVDPGPMQGPADRVGALDGELTVRRGPAGTTVAATVPVRANPARAAGLACWDSITTGPILVPVPQLAPARAAGPARPVRSGATSVLAGARRGHPGLFWLAAALLALAVVSAVGLVVDDRVVLGAPAWAKPLKFALSFALYSLALAWMLSLVEHRRRTGAVLGWIIAVGSAVELVIITGQAARGVRSHFNEDSVRDATLFSIMGLTVAVIWVATLALALVVLRRPSLDRPVASSIRLGLLVALLGMLVGVLMSVNGGHAVGVADGGAGVPLLGWSTAGGDLRVGHFVGMHALQVLPLLAAVLAVPQARQLPELVRLRLVRLAGAGYLGLLLVLVWQALRGQPLTAPDPVTLAVLGALLVAGAAGTAVIVRRPGPEQPQS
jgi:hypothetical protein